MPGKKYEALDGYMYKFNGKEGDDEVKGNGNQLDFGNRIYDPRIGRWLSVDPLEKKFTGLSPYCFAINSPLITVDFDGKDIIIVTSSGTFRLAKETLLKTTSGRALWNKYGKSKSVDIYIAVGPQLVSSGAGASTLFSIAGTMVHMDKVVVDPKDKARADFKIFNGLDVKRSKGKEIGLILFNDRIFGDNEADKYFFLKRLDNPTQFVYDLAETIFHEMKAHVDLHGAKNEHAAYGKSTMGVFRAELAPTKGSPAEKIKEQLHDEYLKGFMDNIKSTSPPPQKNSTNQTNAT